MSAQTASEKMQESFLKWFHEEWDVDPARTNKELVAALCSHIATGWHFTEHEVARAMGTTTTLEAFAEWLHIAELIKPTYDRFTGENVILVTYRGMVYPKNEFYRARTWRNGFHGVKQKLILFEFQLSGSAHEDAEQMKAAKLASWSNSVFMVTPVLVERFLNAVDNW